MAPGSTSHHIFSFYFVALSAFRSHFAINLEGIDNPFIALGASSFVFAQVLWTWRDSPIGFIPWFSKWGKYLLLLCCIALSSSREKPTQAQEAVGDSWRRRGRIFGAVAGEDQVLGEAHPSKCRNSSLAFTFLPLVFLSPTSEKQKFTKIFAFFVCPFLPLSLCSLVCLSACWSHHDWKHQTLWLLEY